MIARNPVKSHSLSLKLHKRAHYCIVLHRSDQHMVAWFQDPLEENIKAHSDVLGENHIFALPDVKWKNRRSCSLVSKICSSTE